jgi:hypothetical protein
MAEWTMVEKSRRRFRGSTISRNGVFSSLPVDIDELAVERRGVSALTLGRTNFSNPAIRERNCPMTSR